MPAPPTKRVKVAKVSHQDVASNSVRVRNLSIYRPIVYGSVATPYKPDNRPATLPPDHTHKWTVMVRGVRGGDVSHFIKKVQFKLHETYANPVRTIETPPFEVSETGWGEFEIQIKIYFVAEANEKPCSLFHFLTLHPYGPDAEEQRAAYRPVFSFTYDELVFPEPTEAMFNILTSKGGVTLPNNKGNEMDPFSWEVEAQEMDRLGLKIKEVEKAVEDRRIMIKDREEKLAKLREERARREVEKAAAAKADD